MCHATSVACVYDFFCLVVTLWRLYPRQRQHQLTWQTAPLDRLRSMCPQLHSSLNCPACPLTWQASLSACLSFMFPSIVFVSHPHLDRALLHKRPSLSSKPRVSVGHRRSACLGWSSPDQEWPRQSCQLPVAPLWRCTLETCRKREGPSSPGIAFRGWWWFFCVVFDRPHPHSSTWVDREVRRQRRSAVPDGIRKIVSVMLLM